MNPDRVSTAVPLKEVKGKTAVSGFLPSAEALTPSVSPRTHTRTHPHTNHPHASESTPTHFSLAASVYPSPAFAA